MRTHFQVTLSAMRAAQRRGVDPRNSASAQAEWFERLWRMEAGRNARSARSAQAAHSEVDANRWLSEYVWHTADGRAWEGWRT